jgi:hypothetical protein
MRIDLDQIQRCHAARWNALTVAIRESARLDRYRRLACVATLLGALWVVYREGLTGALALKILSLVGAVWLVCKIAGAAWVIKRMQQIDREFPKPEVRT